MPITLNLPRYVRQYLLLSLLIACLRISASAATTFTVTNTNNSGAGSLRQAILDANSNPGTDSITFNIGSGLQTIALTSELPGITDPVVIDGTTQPGFSGIPLIEIDATNASPLPNAPVLFINASNTTVRSLILNHLKAEGDTIVDVGERSH